MERAERQERGAVLRGGGDLAGVGPFSLCMTVGIIAAGGGVGGCSLRWVPLMPFRSMGGQNRPRQGGSEPGEETTGNAEVDKMLQDGRLAIAEMKRLDDSIADEGISADIVRLEQVSQKIFDEVKRDEKSCRRSENSWTIICPPR